MKRILVTGGTGSFGTKFIENILETEPNIERLVVYSRDELKQWELQQKLPIEKYPQMRFFIGDTRDKERLLRALQGIDTVVHAAALKQVPSCEFHPFEAVKTNIIGTENLLNTCLNNNVEKVICLSTDKAVYPINTMGLTKSIMEKLCISKSRVRFLLFCRY